MGVQQSVLVEYCAFVFNIMFEENAVVHQQPVLTTTVVFILIMVQLP